MCKIPKVYVCARFTHYDTHLFEHFMKYYLNLGVYKFLINFNYKLTSNLPESHM